LFCSGTAAAAPQNPLVHDLDRARGVQNTVDENTDKARKAVQAQENGDASPP
jgi:hypothetical protein